MTKTQRIIVAVLIILLGISIPYFYLRTKTATVSFSAEPPYRIFVGLSEYQATTNPYDLKLKAGNYHITFVKEHFAPISQTLELKSEEQKTIEPQFVFTPYLEESLVETPRTSSATVPSSANGCERQILTSAGHSLIYCYNYDKNIGQLQRFVANGPPQTLATFYNLASVDLVLSPDEKKLLIYSVWMEDGDAYLVDLQTGYKELLWNDQNVLSAYFSSSGQELLLEKIQGAPLEDIIPTKLSYLSLTDHNEHETDLALRLSSACVSDKLLYSLSKQETIIPNKLETLEDLQRSFAEALDKQSPETIWTQVLQATDLKDLSTKQVLALDPDLPELDNLICDEQAGKIYLESLEDEHHYVIHLTEP